jgi:drug/metabolite transporter (DMT)-like permease
MMSYTGELAALLTSLCYAASSTVFTLAGRRLGASVVNRARLVLAAVMLSLVHWFSLGQPLPLDADPRRWFWLAASGIVGLVIGDQFLFHAYVEIGPRLGLLMLSLVPALAAIIAWLFLSETLGGIEILGILLTLSGIAWVVLQRRTPQNHALQPQHSNRGILYGLGAALGQALGLVLAKQGLGGDFPALSGNVIRMISAMITIWALAWLGGQAIPTLKAVSTQRKVLPFVLAGASIGPVLGVSFALYSIQHTSIGVASTLQSLSPVFLLPVGYFFFKERFGWGAVAGTLVAIAGVALLFF